MLATSSAMTAYVNITHCDYATRLRLTFAQ